jgi:hypothetical protein
MMAKNPVILFAFWHTGVIIKRDHQFGFFVVQARGIKEQRVTLV